MKKYYVMFVVTMVTLLGCTKMIRVDADTYMYNQEFYKGKSVLIETDLEDVIEHYRLLKGQDVELTAFVGDYGEWGLGGWYVILKKDGNEFRCYEEKYKYYLPWEALYLVRWARSEGGEITARGRLRNDGVELYQLAYRSLIVNTNAVPFGDGGCYNCGFNNR